MIRIALCTLLAGLSFGCASTSLASHGLGEGGFKLRTVPRAELVEPASAAVASASASAILAAPVSVVPEPIAGFVLEPTRRTLAPLADESDTYTVLKAGYFTSDEDSLEDGFIVNAAFGRRFGRLLALELEVGYIDSDGTDDAGFSGDFWGIPVMVNGRIDIEILILTIYGGVGIGGIYFDADASNGIIEVEDDGFLFAGNAFLGASIGIGGLSAGLEAKYYVTEDLDGFDESLDALAVMLTLGFGV